MTQPKPILQKKLKKIRRLKKAKKFAEAEVAGGIACRRFPKNKTLLSEHADTAVRQERWASAIKRLNLLLAYQEMGAAAEQTIHRLVAIYISLGQPGEARLRVAQALEECPGSFTLRKTMAELHLLRPEGAANPGLWRDLAATPELDSADDAIRAKVVAACVAGLRLADCAAEARELLARHYRPENPAWQRYIKDGYAKVVVYDNGRTRLETR